MRFSRLLALLLVLTMAVPTAALTAVISAADGGLPSITATVPASASSAVMTVYSEDFEGSTASLFESTAGKTYNKSGEKCVTEQKESGNSVLDIDYSKLDWGKIAEKGGTATRNPISSSNSTKTGEEYDFPELEQGFVLSLDFRKVTDAVFTGKEETERLHISYYAELNNRKGFEIFTEPLKAGEWYKITITAANGGQTFTVTATDKAGTVTELKWNHHAGMSSGSYNKISIIPITRDGDVSEGRQETHFQIDNILLTTESKAPITAVLTPDTAIKGEVTPILVGYDSQGKVTAMVTGAMVDTAKSTKSEFFMLQYEDALKASKSVKVLYWENLQSAKPYANPVEIGDKIDPAVGTAAGKTESFAITSAMTPTGTADAYSILVYAVPNFATKEAIPGYDAASHTLLYLGQSGSAFTSVPYDGTLFDSATQDIVVTVHNGKTSVTTLIEYTVLPSLTNIVIQLGENESKLNFTWFSLSDAIGKISFAKESELVNGQLPANATVVTADRTESVKAGYFGNKATIEGLEPSTTYYYQITNGTDKTDLTKIATSDSDSFTFAFAGDPQIGRGYGSDYSKAMECIEADGEAWGRTLSQMENSPEFAGVDFLMVAGDLTNTHLIEYYKDYYGLTDAASNFIGQELQWDAYSNQEELLGIPTVTVLGNHDNDPYAVYPSHLNQPNMLKKPDGTYYGATYETRAGNYLHSADYYFTYNSVLFIVLNVNNFKATSASAAATAADKAVAEEHGEFVKRVMEETKGQEFDWTIVLYHESPYGSSYHGNYTVNSSGEFNRTEQYAFINMRTYLLPILYENGVDLILSGHDHCYTRTHILKPATDENGNYIDASIITPYEDGSYVYEDGSTTPKFVSWKDDTGKIHTDLKVESKPVKVINPDGILHVTGANSTGSLPNAAQYENIYTAVKATADKRHLTRIDVSENELTLITYNLGPKDSDNITVVDTFTIVHTSDTDPVVPGTDPVVPGTDPVVPGTDPVVPGTDPVVPGTDPVVPSTDPVEPGTRASVVPIIILIAVSFCALVLVFVAVRVFVKRKK